MKMIGYLLILSPFLVSGNLKAQTQQEESNQIKLSKTFSNSSYKNIFTSYPELDRIVVWFKEKDPDHISLHFSQNAKKKDSVEYFRLTFEGDRYFFPKKYGQPMPLLPNVEVDDVVNMKRCENKYELKATIFSDSVKYEFRQYCPPDKRVAVLFGEYAIGAGYKGGHKQLESYIVTRYNKRQYSPLADSVFLFQGVVERNGMLSNAELVMGTPVAFSDFIMTELQTSNFWIPAIQGGRPVRTTMKIYIRLNSDGSITALISGGSYDKSI